MKYFIVAINNLAEELYIKDILDENEIEYDEEVESVTDLKEQIVHLEIAFDNLEDERKSLEEEVELLENEIGKLKEDKIKMIEILSAIAYPRRGTNEETMTLQDFAELILEKFGNQLI